MKVAIAGFAHETVTFLPSETGVGCFEAAASRGGDIAASFTGTNTVCGGFLDTLLKAGVDVAPILMTEWPPSGPVSEAAFEAVTTEIVDGIAAQVDEVDGVLLYLHGAMATAERQDPEWAFMERLRLRIGRDMPVAVAMDLHGNLSSAFVALCDIICGFHHSPHTDMAETGRRAARLLLQLIAGDIKPVIGFRKPGVALPSVFTATAVPPLADIYASARVLSQQPGVLDVSLFTGFAYADVGCIGASAIVITDGDEMQAARLATDLSGQVHTQRDALYRRADLLTVPDAVTAACASIADGDRPVVILEHADRGNDSTYVLEALLEQQVPRVFVPYLTDATTARAAANTGVGGRIMTTVGGKSSDPAGDPVLISAEVRFTGEMTYSGTGPYRTGEPVDLGLCAVLDTGTATIIVTSTNVVAVDLDPFHQFGLDPNDFDIVLLRSKTHFRAVYQELAAAIFIAETPDWGRADLSALTYRNIPADVFPITA